MNPVNTLLTAFFSPVAQLGSTPRQEIILVIFCAAGLVSLISTLVYKMFVNQEEMRDIKKKLETLQKKLQKAQTEQKTEEMQKIFQQITTIQFDMMGKTMKPTMFSLIPILMIFTWIRAFVGTYGPLEYVIIMPFPFFYKSLGWLGWYILSSLAISFPLRKLLGVEH